MPRAMGDCGHGLSPSLSILVLAGYIMWDSLLLYLILIGVSVRICECLILVFSKPFDADSGLQLQV